MRLVSVAVGIALVGAGLASGQKLSLKFDAVAAKASKKVELDLDTKLLRLAARFSGDREARDLLAGVNTIHVRNYEFSGAGSYSQADLDGLRNQVAGQPRWSKILYV